MNIRATRRAVVAILLAHAFGAAIADEAKGTFGFAAKVDVDGSLTPTLKSVFIQSVQPGLPAALAGVMAGDSILEVDGMSVAGAKASTMAEHVKKKPGEVVVLRLVRPGGEAYVVKLTAVGLK